MNAQQLEASADQAQRKTITVLAEENKRLRAALTEVCGCFDAAYAEGLLDRLAEAKYNGERSLPDLFHRRLKFAHDAAMNALNI